MYVYSHNYYAWPILPIIAIFQAFMYIHINTINWMQGLGMNTRYKEPAYVFCVCVRVCSCLCEDQQRGKLLQRVQIWLKVLCLLKCMEKMQLCWIVWKFLLSKTVTTLVTWRGCDGGVHQSVCKSTSNHDNYWENPIKIGNHSASPMDNHYFCDLLTSHLVPPWMLSVMIETPRCH